MNTVFVYTQKTVMILMSPGKQYHLLTIFVWKSCLTSTCSHFKRVAYGNLFRQLTNETGRILIFHLNFLSISFHFATRYQLYNCQHHLTVAYLAIGSDLSCTAISQLRLKASMHIPSAGHTFDNIL